MKHRISAIVLSAALITGGVADACQKGAAHTARSTSAGMRGKITAVSGSTFTMTVGRRGTTHSMVVTIGRATTIGGITAFNSSIIGEVAMVKGSASGNMVFATSITITPAHHGKSTT